MVDIDPFRLSSISFPRIWVLRLSQEVKRSIFPIGRPIGTLASVGVGSQGGNSGKKGNFGIIGIIKGTKGNLGIENPIDLGNFRVDFILGIIGSDRFIGGGLSDSRWRNPFKGLFSDLMLIRTGEIAEYFLMTKGFRRFKSLAINPMLKQHDEQTCEI